MKQIFDYTKETHMLLQPECPEDCQNIRCVLCVFDKYWTKGHDCPFLQYMRDYPVEKPTDTDKLSNALQDQRSAQDILNMCASLQANTLQMQVEPLQNMVNVLDLIIEVTEKQDTLTKIQQEKQVQEDQSNVPTWFLPSMENANDDVDGRDHYHHCPEKDNKLVRLIYVKEDKVHACPTCRRVFYLK